MRDLPLAQRLFNRPSQFSSHRTIINYGQLSAYRNVSLVAAAILVANIFIPINTYRALAILVIAVSLLAWRNVSNARVKITTTGLTAPDYHRNGKPVTIKWADVKLVSVQTFDFGIAYLDRLDGSPNLATGGADKLISRNNLFAANEDDDPLDRIQFIIVDAGYDEIWIKTDDVNIARAILRTLSWWHAEYGPSR